MGVKDFHIKDKTENLLAKLIQIGCRHKIKLDGQSNKSTTPTWSFSLGAFALGISNKLHENNFPMTCEKLYFR